MRNCLHSQRHPPAHPTPRHPLSTHLYCKELTEQQLYIVSTWLKLIPIHCRVRKIIILWIFFAPLTDANHQDLKEKWSQSGQQHTSLSDPDLRLNLPPDMTADDASFTLPVDKQHHKARSSPPSPLKRAFLEVSECAFLVAGVFACCCVCLFVCTDLSKHIKG